jgi:dolichol-phosphate mannosyltransferase
MNEEETLPRSAQQLISTLACGTFLFELIFVDDGSTDETPELLRELQEKDSRIRALRLSRNFGHQVAITAGLENAASDVVAIIDADLQHPPEVLLSFIEKWREGYDVAYGMRAAERDTEATFKVWTAKLFFSTA